MKITKRAFLSLLSQWTVGTALWGALSESAQAQLFGGGLGWSKAKSTAPIPPPAPTSAVPVPPTPAAAMKVPFLTPGSPGYNTATRTYYPSPCSRPERVYQPKNEEELGQVIRELKGKRFAIRGGGHSFGNRSSNSNIVIDTSQLKGSGSGAKLDKSTGLVTVRAGTRLGGGSINRSKTTLNGLYDEVANDDRILAAGTCPDVGVVGNILGGSLSAIPYFGYGSQALREVTFVSFKDGKTYRVTENQISVVETQGRETPTQVPGLAPRDLLKVFRGGGQGSVGVVTEVKLQSQKMRDFRAASFKAPGSVDNTIQWLSGLNPNLRKHVYLEAHFDRNSAEQTLRVLAPREQFDQITRQLQIRGKLNEVKSAKALINSFLDSEGINSGHSQTNGANVMVPIQRSAIDLDKLYRAAGRGIDVALYQAPSSEETIMPQLNGSFMLEMEGNDRNGDLNQAAISALRGVPVRRFANYVTTRAKAKPEEYFDKGSLHLLKRAMDEFNPKVGGYRASTSSVVDASDFDQACELNRSSTSSTGPSGSTR
ncbi:MAG: FAD-binding protein [Bdellovibrionales bacterium]